MNQPENNPLVENYIDVLNSGIGELAEISPCPANYFQFDRVYQDIKGRLNSLKCKISKESVSSFELNSEQVLNLESELLRLRMNKIAKVFQRSERLR